MIKQAIIPLAGLGTRLLPLSSVIPKELLPINGKTNLEHILDECIDAGIKKFILIISKKKENIKKYFFNDHLYKSILAKKKNKRIGEVFKKLKKYQKMIKFVYQNEPKGTGDAILKCKRLIKESHFLMLFPDDLIVKRNCSKEMIALYKKTKGSIISTKTVKKNVVSRYGILSLEKKNKYFTIKDVVEKPSLKNSPSNYAIVGRYILPKTIMSELKNVNPGQGGELHITDAIKKLIKNGEKFYANKFKGEYLDCGTLDGYIISGTKIVRGKK
jgi:UTP--glucose-1-phosphate uridylyltransferase